MRDEPVIREQLAGISDCDLALYSIGTVDAESHVVKCGALSAAEMDALRAAGAAGVVAGQIIDGKGALLDCSYNRRVISADLASLRAIPKRLVVVQEDEQVRAAARRPRRRALHPSRRQRGDGQTPARPREEPRPRKAS